MSTDAPQKFIFFHYYPSKEAGLFMVVLFALTPGLHVFQLLKKRTWYFIPFVIGGFCKFTFFLFKFAELAPLLACALFAASIYMILGQIIHLLDGKSHSIIRATWLTRIFVGGDVLSFLAQSAGGGIQAKASNMEGAKLGQNVIVGSLSIQLFFFGFFIVTAGNFHYLISCFPTTRSVASGLPWQMYLLVLYTGPLLIIIRSIFRIIGYVIGQDGILLADEIYVYIFDAGLMFAVMALFNWFQPGVIIAKKTIASLNSQDQEGTIHDDDHMMADRRNRGSKTHINETMRAS